MELPAQPPPKITAAATDPTSCRADLSRSTHDGSIAEGLRTPPIGEVGLALLDPSSKLAQGKLPDHPETVLAVIEAGDRGEVLTPVLTKDRSVLDRDLF